MAAEPEPAIFILDDDESVRRALARLLRAAGMAALTFANVEELLATPALSDCTCIVADIRMPGTSALALPQLLEGRDLNIPVIFVSAQDIEQTRADAKHVGAAGFFRKPVDDQALLDAVAWAIRRDSRQIGS